MSNSWELGEELISNEIRIQLAVIQGNMQMLEMYGIYPKSEKSFKAIYKAVDNIVKISKLPELAKVPEEVRNERMGL